MTDRVLASGDGWQIKTPRVESGADGWLVKVPRGNDRFAYMRIPASADRAFLAGKRAQVGGHPEYGAQFAAGLTALEEWVG